MGEAAKALLFEGVKAGCDVYCVAGVALPGILTCLQECRKSFSVTGALLWHGFHEDELHFSWQVLHFGDLNRHFCVADAAIQTCRVAFFWRIALPRLRQVVPMCKFRGRHGAL